MHRPARHVADESRVAVRLAHADGRDEPLRLRRVDEGWSRFAHSVDARGIGAGDRGAMMLEPSLMIGNY